MTRLSKNNNRRGKAYVEFFDPTCDIDGACSPSWLSPILWNQGGYDAVFIDLDDEHLVRFIRITRAEQHSFKPDFFNEVLLKLKVLSERQGGSIRQAELVYVVPYARLDTFKRLDADVFMRDVVDPSFRAGLKGSEQNIPAASVQVVDSAVLQPTGEGISGR